MEYVNAFENIDTLEGGNIILCREPFESDSLKALKTECDVSSYLIRPKISKL